MSILQFPMPRQPRSGVIHVWGTPAEGFSVSHESRSGDSWGEIYPFDCAARAINFAHFFNAHTYAGECEVSLSDRVRAEARG